jgi:hypothetical protein
MKCELRSMWTEFVIAKAEVYCVRNVLFHGIARGGIEGETGEWSG